MPAPLRPWTIYRLRRDLIALDGRTHRAGDEFRLRQAVGSEFHGLDAAGAATIFVDPHPKAFQNTGQTWRAPQPGDARDEADALYSAALAAQEPAAARALADRALTLYHAWMAEATSGGDGCARQNEIRHRLERLRQMLA